MQHCKKNKKNAKHKHTNTSARTRNSSAKHAHHQALMQLELGEKKSKQKRFSAASKTGNTHAPTAVEDFGLFRQFPTLFWALAASRTHTHTQSNSRKGPPPKQGESPCLECFDQALLLFSFWKRALFTSPWSSPASQTPSRTRCSRAGSRHRRTTALRSIQADAGSSHRLSPWALLTFHLCARRSQLFSLLRKFHFRRLALSNGTLLRESQTLSRPKKPARGNLDELLKRETTRDRTRTSRTHARHRMSQNQKFSPSKKKRNRVQKIKKERPKNLAQPALARCPAGPIPPSFMTAYRKLSHHGNASARCHKTSRRSLWQQELIFSRSASLPLLQPKMQNFTTRGRNGAASEEERNGAIIELKKGKKSEPGETHAPTPTLPSKTKRELAADEALSELNSRCENKRVRSGCQRCTRERVGLSPFVLRGIALTRSLLFLGERGEQLFVLVIYGNCTRKLFAGNTFKQLACKLDGIKLVKALKSLWKFGKSFIWLA